MPQYPFINLETEEYAEFYFGMKETPSVGATVEIDGEKWKRLPVSPQAAPNGLKAIDPFSEKAFREKTGAMKGTIGDLWDASKELSERRAEKMGGVDKIKQKFYDNYRKGSKSGISHSQELAEGHKQAKDALDKGLKKIAKETGLD